METARIILHWTSYAYYLYVFAYASLFKVFQKQSMMESMQSLGFNKTWTIAIGIAELIGVLLVVAGVYKPSLKIIGVLFLFPFAIGAFTTHMAHQEYEHYYQSLAVCVLSVVILWTDKTFKIML
ncbi:DoxX family protein [Pseudochryseolinea flava]|uniref:DoxX family protein n=1 Tax=Pseudochryseolinea flava TaxID=2059302 RepID=A0A364XW90_9BACT|nr:DoxX family protein [Pseudochryseolinea flava]RAV98221.1 hypothetical protein DQQ10_24785 [Pseudochryseolinea flava]